MRVLRALFYFAAAKYEDAEGKPLIRENPVGRLSSVRSWYRVQRRQTVIKPHQLPAGFKAVMALKPAREGSNAELARDYLLCVLFTGMRKEVAARLKWAQIDFEDRTVTIKDPKNRDDVTLPLPDFLQGLLRKRSSDANAEAEYVFPGIGRAKHGADLRHWIEKVSEDSGLKFTMHDVRRTFATTAEGLDISTYALKRLLNHKINKSDGTAGYIITDVERLRAPVRKIESHLLRLARGKPQGEVVDIRHGAQ